MVAALQVRANIDPSMTNLVWQKLEEQNPDFFQAYKIQLRLKDQIMLHNCMVRIDGALSTGKCEGLTICLTTPVQFPHMPTTCPSAVLCMSAGAGPDQRPDGV